MGGNKAGVQIRFTDDDVELLHHEYPLDLRVARQGYLRPTVVNETGRSVSAYTGN